MRRSEWQLAAKRDAVLDRTERVQELALALEENKAICQSVTTTHQVIQDERIELTRISQPSALLSELIRTSAVLPTTTDSTVSLFLTRVDKLISGV